MSRLNGVFSRIARQAGLSLTLPHNPKRTYVNGRSQQERLLLCVTRPPVSTDACSKCSKTCSPNQRLLRSESKGKGSSKVSTATSELQHLMDFNSSITQEVAKTMEHLTDFVFVFMGNLTLARRDSYLTHVKTGIKPDTLAALRTAPLQAGTLFPDSMLKHAEDDIAHFETFDHRLSWISMDVQGHKSVDVHVLLNGIMVKDHRLTDHGQSPWSVKAWSSPWTLTMVSVHGHPCFVKWHHAQSP